MFNVSYNLNKISSATILFADENFNFSHDLPVNIKKNMNNINLFKKEYEESSFVEINLFQNKQKHKFIIYKIKTSFLDYDFQKLGGNVYDSISKIENVNLILDSADIIKISFDDFVKNFFLGLFSSSLSKDKNKLI